MRSYTITLLFCLSGLLLLCPVPSLAFYPIITLFLLKSYSYYTKIRQCKAYMENAKNQVQQSRNGQ